MYRDDVDVLCVVRCTFIGINKKRPNSNAEIAEECVSHCLKTPLR